MGYAESNLVMDSRAGSVSFGLGCSSSKKKQPIKSSPFCPRSTSRVEQSIIRDHMVAHYKKVYSAKAAIDVSAPKSIIYSVKYNDRLRQERLRKEGRPQSAHSLSQKNSRASCSSAQSRLSLQYDDNQYLHSRSSVASRPRFPTSFHPKDIVYQSCELDHCRHTCPASDLKSGSPESALHREHSACSLQASGGQSCYKSFQDPAKKTYSGDLLHKHSQHFTQEKPFTPVTLKSAHSSFLATYRYYRAPRNKPPQGSTSSKLSQQKNSDKSTEIKEHTQDFEEPSQGFVTSHELSEAKQYSLLNKSRDHYLFDSSSRVSSLGWKSPNMKKISAEEEELMYLEFISAVTDDILSRRYISDSVLDRVMKRHIDMNRHQLDEGKMRHLLVILRKDLEDPTDRFTSSAQLERKGNSVLDAIPPYLEPEGKQVKTKEDSDVFAYASLIQYCDSPIHADALSVSSPVLSPERTTSPKITNEKDEESNSQEKYISSPLPNEYFTDNTGISEEDNQDNHTGTIATNVETRNENYHLTTITSDEPVHQDQANVNNDGQSKELEDLGKSLSESLYVSSNTASVETAPEQHENTVISLSDDEF